MGRHSQPDLGDATSAPPSRASRPLATGEPTWEHWWEKTGGQPRILDPVLDEPVRSGPAGRAGRPPVAGSPAGLPPPRLPPRGRPAAGPAEPPPPTGHGQLRGPVEPVLPPVTTATGRPPSGLAESTLPPAPRRRAGRAADASAPAGETGPPRSAGLRGGTGPISAAAMPASPPPPGPASTGPIGLSPAFPLTPDEPAPARRSLRSVPSSAESGRPGSVRGGLHGRGGRPAGYPGAAAAAAAVPLSYDTSLGLPTRTPAETPAGPAVRRRHAGAGSPPGGPAGQPERSRLADSPRRREPGGAPATAILPAPGLRAAPAPDSTGETPRVGAAPADRAAGRSTVRALPDSDADPSRPGRSAGSGRAGRGRRAEQRVDDTAERERVERDRAGRDRAGRDRAGRDRADRDRDRARRDRAAARRPAAEPDPADPDPADPRSVRSLHAVEADPDASENTGIHYGFEDEPSLLLQWGGFIAQTVVGAVCGLGTWLGFYQLWDRWPFYTAPAAGAAMAIMLAITRSIRRRYGHELDLLTAVVTVGVGVVLTVLPAAFVLQHV